jgi:hypothetical protein
MKARDCLVQEHAQASDAAEPLGTRGGQQRCLERYIDVIGHHE